MEISLFMSTEKWWNNGSVTKHIYMDNGRKINLNLHTIKKVLTEVFGLDIYGAVHCLFYECTNCSNKANMVP